MADFKSFKKSVNVQFGRMCLADKELFVADIDGQDVWEKYLCSFPPGSDPLFRTRSEHDCQNCKTFIKRFGNIVAISSTGKLMTIWDHFIDLDYPYHEVAKAMAEYVRGFDIKSVWRTDLQDMGIDHNFQILRDDEGNETGKRIKWEHFHCIAPLRFVIKQTKIEDEDDPKTITGFMAESRTRWGSFQRALNELSIDAIDTVIALIGPKDPKKRNDGEEYLYKGLEYLNVVSEFRKYKITFDKLKTAKGKKQFTWVTTAKKPNISGIRKSVIGTLLQDLSEGVVLENAVRSFEFKVAPANFKRSSAIVTKPMIDRAKKKLIELGMEKSIYRRHAVIGDLTINNVLYADKTAQKVMGEADPFDVMMKSAPESKSPRKDANFQNIPVEDFFAKIVPEIQSMEVLLENTHSSNMCSIIAPTYDDAPNLFKWDNGFSWWYNGDVTDALKEKIKKAGGSFNAWLRFTLEWFNTDDLDIHSYGPLGEHIYHSKNGVVQRSSGLLDIDMNVEPDTTEPIENIIWTDPRKMPPGDYEIKVHQYTLRNNENVGFSVEMEHEGALRNFVYNQKVASKKYISVCKFHLDKDKNIKITGGLASTNARFLDIWGMKTGNFQPVDLIMLSPNYWDGQEIGNKHWFFLLRDCINDQSVRGFYPEFLHDDLHEHRKVFEHLGSQLMTTPITEPKLQMSGLGFSSTLRKELKCRVHLEEGYREYNIRF